MQISMDALLTAILKDDRPRVKDVLKADRGLATRRIDKPRLYQSEIFHWIYEGDTALHLAAAGYRVEIARFLLAAGADPNAAMNHRRSSPLHYAADGYVNGPAWDAKRQVKTVRCLLEAGADVNAQARMAPLLCTARSAHDARPRQNACFKLAPIRRGETNPGPRHFILRCKTPVAAEPVPRWQKAHNDRSSPISTFGVSTGLKDGEGKSVFDRAKRGWMRSMLIANAAVIGELRR